MKLKPCPFCGRVPIGAEDREQQGWRVRCDEVSCRAKVECRDTEAQAIAAWNRRPSDPRMEAMEKVVEAVRKAEDKRRHGTPFTNPSREDKAWKMGAHAMLTIIEAALPAPSPEGKR